MRVLGAVALLLALAACGEKKPPDSSTLILNDPRWDRVNVEIVMTKRSDCDSRADGFISTRQLEMKKQQTERFYVPNGATICWRHDRDPNKPVPGAWSDWTKATIDVGGEAETEL